jgi:hypothetical protein
VCGGGPRLASTMGFHASFSPGVRGWTEPDPGPAVIVDVFPRCAGVDRRDGSRRTPCRSFPPVCGGGPFGSMNCSMMSVFSPGVRGWTVGIVAEPVVIVVFPRCAGVDRRRSLRCRFRLTSPPVRGGEPSYPLSRERLLAVN